MTQFDDSCSVPKMMSSTLRKDSEAKAFLDLINSTTIRESLISA